MEFQFRCPKCRGLDYSIVRDTRSFTPSRTEEYIFSCRCGRQMFGDQIEGEYQRQKAEFEQSQAEKARQLEEQRLKAEEEARQQEALAKALEYRKRYQAEQLRKKQEEEARRKEEEEQRWRERVARAAAEEKARLAALAAAPPPAPPPPQPEPEPAPAAPEPASLPFVELRVLVDDGISHPEDGEEGDGDSDHDTPAVGEQLAADHPDKCAWNECFNRRRPNSKYCSRNCSNKNARSRHKRRGGKDAA